MAAHPPKTGRALPAATAVGAWERLLIRCPRARHRPQITALAHWLRHQPSPRIALGSHGIRVGPADWPTPSSAERRKLFRDALRLTLWRATGSTGAWLAHDALAVKRADCGV
ncbi:hypothetical protein KBZ07_11230 [Cyanobium sp. BA20m-14]|uniref:hypothetical protein n=1 Tax=Cyanobium sp. BA20m-14 TaxID=2823703 RepID=UPI0020CDE851|nr:hypothetical protein [Cyanobium sp. BA20m-14]MCP9913964.1 hypothetical protein [Cyanobium sp. BA20m-14]